MPYQRRVNPDCKIEVDANGRAREHWCREISPAGGWLCTRKKDHKGPHASAWRGNLSARWGWVR